jgi:hypothetical protein
MSQLNFYLREPVNKNKRATVQMQRSREDMEGVQAPQRASKRYASNSLTRTKRESGLLLGEEVGGRDRSFVQDWGKVYSANFWRMSGRRCGGGVEPPDIFVGVVFSPASIMVWSGRRGLASRWCGLCCRCWSGVFHSLPKQS